MDEIRKAIPNALTSGNLLLGCLAIIAALGGKPEQASWMIAAAAILDFFDGFIARALKATSEIGKQLDSLADMVTFGVAPGMILYMMNTECFASAGFCINQYIPLLIPIFGALRLAKFNIDTRQSDTFIGVPTPAIAMFVASIPLIISHDTLGLGTIFTNSWFLKFFPVIAAYLMVMEVPLIALKFKNFAWQGNEFRFILILSSLALILLFTYTGVALSIVVYILLSIIQQILKRS